MNIQDDKPRMIFRKDFNNIPMYSIGLAHKKQDGSWERGYMTCRFKKDTDIPNQTKIKINDCWLDFYIKDKATHPYLFINKYEVVQDDKKENIQVPASTKTEYKGKNINITDEDINKVFDNDLELPF